MADRLAGAERAHVLTWLEWLERVTADISTRLSHADADKAAILLECAARDFAAAAWDLETPVRLRPRGWLSAGDGQQGAAGTYQG